ncbi:UNVERIFIED_CONTAM: Formin-like protein 18 [Sesamum indicum]
MALFRKFFYRKPPEGLLEISDRVYVFDCCFTANLIERNEYEVYIGCILNQLHEYFPDSSFMVFNFEDEENTGQITEVLSEYVTTVIDYPSQYENCPLLTLEMIHHFLKSSESWLCIGQRNVLLMHCENRALPILAFMLAALLIYMKQYTGEQRTLEMIYKQAPQQLLQLLLPLNPLPSQLRYLQYVSRRNIGSRWPPLDRALTLDCIILRVIPDMDGKGGCRPLVRIYGQDPLMAADRTTKVLFSMPKRTKTVGYVKQVVFHSCPLSTLLIFSSLLVHAPASCEENADCELVKIDINCHVQGDVVLECITLDENLEHEEMMFRVMFNTAFIRSNILMLTRDEIDILWNAKDQFPKDFRAEIELRRAYNCEIMLTKVKVPLSDLMFFLELIKVPRVESKLRVFSFKIQFSSQVSDLRNSLNTVNSTSEEASKLCYFHQVRKSVKLKRIMQTILSLGNALNHGTARGSAVGFRLDSLLKLTETRARNNKLTLMHYLCKVLAEKLPEVLDFHKDLVSLEAATKGKNADALALYFGEDPARCPFEQVVSTLLNFVRMFQRCHEENCKQQELEKKKAQQEAENGKGKLNTSRKELENENVMSSAVVSELQPQQ